MDPCHIQALNIKKLVLLCVCINLFVPIISSAMVFFPLFILLYLSISISNGNAKYVYLYFILKCCINIWTALSTEGYAVYLYEMDEYAHSHIIYNISIGKLTPRLCWNVAPMLVAYEHVFKCTKFSIALRMFTGVFGFESTNINCSTSHWMILQPCNRTF